MKRALAPTLLLLLLLSACAGVRDAPSLAPRIAEAVDPRLPVPDTAADIPRDATLTVRLDALVAQARNIEGPFVSAIANAERLAAAAGPRQSESWIAAQQALSAAIAARYPLTRALGDLNALSAERLRERGGIVPADLAAIRAASESLAALDRRQAARVDAVQRRLGG